MPYLMTTRDVVAIFQLAAHAAATHHRQQRMRSKSTDQLHRQQSPGNSMAASPNCRMDSGTLKKMLKPVSNLASLFRDLVSKIYCTCSRFTRPPSLRRRRPKAADGDEE